jgi:hypothetical protein
VAGAEVVERQAYPEGEHAERAVRPTVPSPAPSSAMQVASADAANS